MKCKYIQRGQKQKYTSSDILDGTPIKVNKILLLAFKYQPAGE